MSSPKLWVVECAFHDVQPPEWEPTTSCALSRAEARPLAKAFRERNDNTLSTRVECYVPKPFRPADKYSATVIKVLRTLEDLPFAQRRKVLTDALYLFERENPL
jgi:hypothetical protein